VGSSYRRRFALPSARVSTASLIFSSLIRRAFVPRVGLIFATISVCPVISNFVLCQAATKEAIISDKNSGAKLFGPILDRMDQNVKTLQSSELGANDRYNSSDVNVVINRTAVDILARIPEDDEQLTAYVRQRIPRPLDTNRVYVPKAEADSQFSLLKALLSKLVALPALRLDVTIGTQPTKAAFEFVSAAGTRLSTTTNDVLTNVYRGEYEYSVAKTGYKTIHATIDLVDRAGTTLNCELVTDSDSQPALPCTFR
jgi:hypothetical protein